LINKNVTSYREQPFARGEAVLFCYPVKVPNIRFLLVRKYRFESPSEAYRLEEVVECVGFVMEVTQLPYSN